MIAIENEILIQNLVFKGLFHRVILMSGSAMSDWAITTHPSEITTQILNKLNCPLTDEDEEILKCLRKLNYTEISKMNADIPDFTTAFGPIVDYHLIQDSPQKLMAQQSGATSRSFISIDK